MIVKGLVLPAGQHTARGRIAPLLLQVVLAGADDLVVQAQARVAQRGTEVPSALVAILFAGGAVPPSVPVRVGDGLGVLVAHDVERAIGIVPIRVLTGVTVGWNCHNIRLVGVDDLGRAAGADVAVVCAEGGEGTLTSAVAATDVLGGEHEEHVRLPLGPTLQCDNTLDLGLELGIAEADSGRCNGIGAAAGWVGSGIHIRATEGRAVQNPGVLGRAVIDVARGASGSGDIRKEAINQALVGSTQSKP